ncbi:MAG TPA: NAD(P)H-hydrate dehydratase [Actinomycetota bacterium]|nr:NAD(P)H-hydrate dehydratase [Actinomycetota bacterium]
MLPILTPAESAHLDRESADRGVTVDELMENAGREVARRVVKLVGGAYGHRALVVCGKGNNGGDGWVVARYLDRWGMGVSVVMAEPSTLRGAAGANFGRFAGRGGRWREFSPHLVERELARADVVVDALFGTGFRGRPEGHLAHIIRSINRASAPVVAVDIPSGVEGETGAVRGDAVEARLTVALGTLKPGLVFHPGAAHAGTIEVADIGFPADLVRTDLWLLEATDVAAELEPREAESHKRSVGVVLVVAGSRDMTGAAALTAKAAYRAGAGLVTLAAPPSVLSTVQPSIPDLTFLPLPATEDGTISRDAWPVLRERIQSFDAVAIGPGLSTNPSTSSFVRTMVAESPVRFVLDADGLNAFAGRSGLLADRASDAILTPHAGEFGRLTGLSAKEVVEDRVGHARKAAAEFRCAVLLKGSRTVVADPNGTTFVNPTGGSYLATGGTGDVLTGAIAGFIAGGLAPVRAGAMAAYVHGVAGQLAAERQGEGTIASDVLFHLGEALVRVRTSSAA